MLTEIKRGVRYANWLLNPLYRPEPPAIYDLIGTAAPTSNGLYLNLGFWRNADNLDAACEALVGLVGDKAGFSPDDLVVDCGFGFGDQDIHWVRHHPSIKVIGLNITASQVMAARGRVKVAGLDDQIDLRVGSATAMPVDDGSADVVIALESAFHFRTRERFFREALRVLKPGGRLVTADIIPMHVEQPCRSNSGWSGAWRLTASRFAIPDENAYPLAEYEAVLARTGFQRIDVQSIRDDVYPPLHAHLRENPKPLQALHPLPRIAVQLSLRPSAERIFRGLDYVIGVAHKPGRSGTSRDGRDPAN